MSSNLFVEAHGDGPPVLFLHGAPTPWDVLRPIADACPRRRTLLAALPGYGACPAWTGPVTAVAIAEAIERAALDAGAQRLSIVGFSGGSYHALHVAIRGVLAVDSLVLLGGMADLSDETRAGQRGFAAALRAEQPLGGVATARFLSPAFAARHPDACARVEAWLHATTPENLARELDAVADGPSLLDGLGAFEGRVLARTGALDLACPPANAEEIARRTRVATVQIVPGCGHALLEEDPVGTTAAVLAALG